MPSIALVPIRGITIADSLPEDNFGLLWNVLSAQQARNLVVQHGHMSSLLGNFNMIEARLAPDAYLVVRCEVPDSTGYLQAYDNAETILAALCIAVLLASELWPDPWQQQPTPLYRVRFKEACDLPLVFDEARVRLVGHSSWFSWLSPSDHMLPPVSKQHLFAAMANAPGVVGRILDGHGASNEADHLLTSSLRAMHSALQATTPGQLTANLVSAVELLFSAHDREQWFRRTARLKVVVGWAYWSRCEDVLAARHAFVHESAQPQESFLGHCALAMFVQAWFVFTHLLSRFGGQQPALDFLDQLVAADLPRDRRTSDLTLEEVDQLEVLYRNVPLGPVRTMKWVHQYLVDVHPNDYHRRFVVGGRSSCAGERCGHILLQEHVVAREPGKQMFRCHICGLVNQAALVSPEISQVEN
jgi:hypothetical protein